MHVFIREEVVSGTHAFTVNINCAEPLVVWAPVDSMWGDSHLIDPRELAEACADALVAMLRAK